MTVDFFSDINSQVNQKLPLVDTTCDPKNVSISTISQLILSRNPSLVDIRALTNILKDKYKELTFLHYTPLRDLFFQLSKEKKPLEAVLELKKQLELFLSHDENLIPLPKFHSLLRELAMDLGYPVRGNGLCQGMSMMGLRAAAMGDISSFNLRLEKLAKMAQQNDYDVKSMIHALKQDKAFYWEVRAFFDGVMIAHSPHSHPELFPKGKAPSCQEFSKPVQDLIMSLSPAPHPQITSITSFLNVYENEGLEATFTELKKQAQLAKAPLYILLSSIDHTLTVFYNPTNDSWLFLDTNELPIQGARDETILTEKITNAFENADPLSLSFSVFSSKGNTDLLSSALHVYDWDSHAIPHHPNRLMLAVREHDRHLVEKMLNNHFNINHQDEYLWTPLMMAADIGDLTTTRLLLKQGADVNLTNNEGSTALMLAARDGHIEIIRSLIAAGANVNTCNVNEMDALTLATLNGHDAAVQILAEHRALSLSN